MPDPSPRYLDLQDWPRRESFEWFRGFASPCFDVCVRLDVSALQAALQAAPQAPPQSPSPPRGTAGAAPSITLACYHAALVVANAMQPFRLRLEADAPQAGQPAAPRVRVLERVHGSCTVLRADESLGFGFLGFEPGLACFVQRARERIAAVRRRHEPLGLAEAPDPLALMYFTNLPWLHFTSFRHAHDGNADASIPRLALGRIEPEGARAWMPLALQVHHALVDGLHAGRYVQALQERLASAREWVEG